MTQSLEWFTKARGITKKTLKAFGVTTNENDEVLFPYYSGHKYRSDPTNGDRSFRWDKGTLPSLFSRAEEPIGDTIFLVEGETDTMRLWQELEHDNSSVYGLPGIDTWKSEMAKVFAAASRVYVILDNDSDYLVQAQVNRVWQKIRNDLGKKVRRLYLPNDVKDICEFFDNYTMSTLDELIFHPSPDSFNFRPLDLLRVPPAYDWLIKDFLCKPDTNLIIGEPGIGKSWITMSVAVAIAEGWNEWCGLPVLHQGKVFYVDEENPEDIVLNRLKNLGLTDEGADNIHFLHWSGVRLDKNADKLLDDALRISPQLIILDSFRRLHTQGEDSSGEASALFNDAITPLARETGAAIILIHHVGKSDSTSSFKRTRGSSDIPGAVDAAYDIRPIENTLHVVQFKSRRRGDHEGFYVEIKDTESGVAIERTVDPSPF